MIGMHPTLTVTLLGHRASKWQSLLSDPAWISNLRILFSFQQVMPFIPHVLSFLFFICLFCFYEFALQWDMNLSWRAWCRVKTSSSLNLFSSFFLLHYQILVLQVSEVNEKQSLTCLGTGDLKYISTKLFV